MIPDVSQEIDWLGKHPQTIKGIQRGLERETLRVNADGSLATTSHPLTLGSALTHKWITTDFAEALLEFTTPVDNDIDHMLTLMRDIHRFTARQLGEERMWPLSMPCNIEKEQEIELALYGISNIGRLKTLYREGLKNRYGTLVPIISGVHYNFSLPIVFWQEKCGKINKEVISTGYLRLIRNYYRFGWVIPYLFGASPAVYSSFLKGKTTLLSFKKTDYDTCYLPYATSLRLSNLGYNSTLQNNLGITFNKLHEYVTCLKQAIQTPSTKYEKIGLKKKGKRLQINSNLLLIENELYTPIRPKRIPDINETPLGALKRGGIEYIEVRSLDINPFSPIGVDDLQVRFLDLFMIWCVLADTPEMSSNELQGALTNWNRIILEGRKPSLTLGVGCKTEQFPLVELGKNLFHNLRLVAQILDSMHGGRAYLKVCDELILCFDDPELTFSARILRSMTELEISGTGLALSAKYRNILLLEPLEVLNQIDFIEEKEASFTRLKKIEASDKEPFDVYLTKYS